MKKTGQGWIWFVFIVLAGWRAGAANVPSEDEIPGQSFDDRFSTNWYAAVRAVLPAGDLGMTNFDWKEATNGLARESDQGNLAARSLWGWALLVTSNSPAAKESGLKLLLGSAAQGNMGAMLNLGFLYEGGTYVRRDYDQAFRWFGRAAEAGNSEAELQLGGCYHYGLGITPNLPLAAKYYRLSADQTNFVAMKSLGYLLMNGYGVEKSLDQAKYWFLRSAQEGKNRRAMYNLGAIYMQNGLDHPDDTNAMAEAFNWFKQSAELGDPLGAEALCGFYFRGSGGAETNLAKYCYWRFRAAFMGATDSQFYMGKAYQNGDGLAKDGAESLKWYWKAAAKNHPEAIYNLAVHYLGDQTNRNSQKMAHELMLRAANLGHREAQFQCALSSFRGDFGLDCDGGQDWLMKAATNGWSRAEFWLFELYYKGVSPGKGCPAYPRDRDGAIKWLQQASQQGNLPAQNVLAVMLLQARDMDPDKRAAEKLLRNAAVHGFAQAQNDLGFAILSGSISSADSTEAALWCQLAVWRATDPTLLKRANVNLANALMQLTPEQQQEVQSRAQHFQPVPIPQVDPKLPDWQQNPDYRLEDGRF